MRLSLQSDVILVNVPLALIRNHNEHYSADRIRVYEARLKLLDKVSAHLSSPRLRDAMRIARANTAGSLALVAAVAGMRGYALRMLWRSRSCALKSGAWWPRAASTVLRLVLPRWLQETVRKHRREQRALAGAP